MRTRTVVILAVIGAGAFFLYQHFERERAKEQCYREAIVVADRLGEMKRCFLRFGPLRQTQQ